MKHFFNFLLIFNFAFCGAQDLVDSRQQPIVFKSVNVIPMDKEQVLENQDVVIKAGKIIAIGKSGKVKYAKNALVVDAKGKFLLPGLAEMHAHVPPIDDLEPMKEVLKLFAFNGVTTIRGMLGHPRHLELRQKIQSGEILGPHFYTSGTSLNGNTVKTEAEGVEKVKNQKQAGYDFMKMHPGLTLENFNAIVKTAQELKMPFAGHVSYQVGVWRAIEAGYATIDHLDGFVECLVPEIEKMTEPEIGIFGIFVGHLVDMTKVDKLMKALKDKNIWVVPTQSLAECWFAPDKTAEALRQAPEMKYIKASDLDNWTTAKKNFMAHPRYDSAKVAQYIQIRRKLIYECNRNGVGLLLGSDAPQVFDVPGFSLHQELQYMVASGLSPFEALLTGTVNVAKFYQQTNQGTIRQGNVANLVLLNGNPLQDIRQTQNIAGVMLENQWLSKEFIDKELKKLVK
jgi:imidazolonepropionase-like amidohydrolase